MTPTSEWVAARVIEVIDGDTIRVDIDGKTYTVRYIGIDTPETRHPSRPVEWMGPEATAANRQLVENQIVYLERDVSETDRYGRLLRYVFLADGTFVNAELVRLGYAQVATYPPDVRYQSLFLALQQEARAAERGLWGAPTPTMRPVVAPTATLSTPRPPQASPMPEPPPAASEPVCRCDSDVYNCKDFASQREAQACFEYCRAQGKGDVHRLDRDGDGKVCENLP
ncbi:MAG: thermonuclease family protein [Chloroflexus sp.]